MTEIIHEDYSIHFDSATMTVSCVGRLRLRGKAHYAPIADLLASVVAAKPAVIIVDLRQLRFLNSSGINMFSKFVIKVRKAKSSQLIIRGSHLFPWQEKSMNNLQRLLPTLQLEIE